MKHTASQKDEEFIRTCIALSEQSLKNGDAPFGSIVVCEDKIIAGVTNNAHDRISDHAEILALHEAHKKLTTHNLSSCTLYSNCEPCPMCSFMIREYKIKRVVFSTFSPYVGGYSKWNILSDEEISMFPEYFGKPPEILGGVLEHEAKIVYSKTNLWMFGSDAKNRQPKNI